jgi:hypothetical protein
MTWKALSEVVLGKVIDGEIDPASVNVNDLWHELREGLAYTKNSKDWTKNGLMEVVGFYAFDTAVEASKQIGDLPIDWSVMLKTSAVRFTVGEQCARFGKKLCKGEQLDPSDLILQANKLDLSRRVMISADEVTPEVNPFLASGWGPLDWHVGGFPKSGLSVIGAPPGTGKTTLLLKMTAQSLLANRPVLLFSMEMTSGQLVNRLNDVATLTEAQKKNLLICDEPMPPTEVATYIATASPKPYFVGIDFAELMLTGDGGDGTERAMATVYNTFARSAKSLEVPIVLLSQLSRNYDDDLPRVTHLRYTGMAEALASLILLIYNRNAVFAKMSSGGSLPNVNGKAYIIVGKSRYGHKQMQKGGMGAMQVDWTGKNGWGDNASNQDWFPL